MPPPDAARWGVAVVADDLTGAADTAVHFVRPGREMLLVSLARDAHGRADTLAADLALDTRTRASGPGETVAALQTAAGLVRALRPALVYKKIDSQLRGRPGLEIETLRRELGLSCALVAPAHPDQGRVTTAGVHLVHGVPVAEAEPGRDPVAPVADSRLPALLAEQAGVEVGHVTLADVEGGPAVLARKIESLLAARRRVVSFDATTSRHLDRIAEVAGARFPDALLAGSAGLAIPLARRLGGGARAREAPRCDSLLFVCGSRAGALRRQIARLAADGRCLTVEATPEVEGAPPRGQLEDAAAAWSRSDVVLHAPPDRLDSSCAPSAVLAGLVRLALALVSRRRPGGVFLAGGDTAAAVLAAAGVASTRLGGEAMPGVAWGVGAGGTLDGAIIMTRSGAFGGDEDLVELHRRLGRRATHG